jgi:hypothetical protein
MTSEKTMAALNHDCNGEAERLCYLLRLEEYDPNPLV